MITWNRGAGIPLLLFAAALAAPGYAVAQQPLPAEGAVLYELTENMSQRALQRGQRKAVSELLGFAVRGTPLCPEELVPETVRHCTLNATGRDNISLIPGPGQGLGNFGGDVQVVIQEVNPFTGNPTPDSPEVVIATGKFHGKMDFSPAIVNQIPLGSVKGHLKLAGFPKVPFTGVFRLPFLFPPEYGFGDTAFYLIDPATFGVVPVAPNEKAIGYPAVRFEITF